MTAWALSWSICSQAVSPELRLWQHRASTSKYQNHTKRKLCLPFLNSKPRRSLYRLRLKFVQTTRVVCTDYSWSLQKVLRTYKFKYVYLLKCLHVLTEMSTRTYESVYLVLNCAAPLGLILFCLLCSQGSISGFALILPWAMQECRAYGSRKAEVLPFWILMRLSCIALEVEKKYLPLYLTSLDTARRSQISNLPQWRISQSPD